MPKRKASKGKREASKKAHDARGCGSKSRISLDFEKLKKAGWTIEERASTSSQSTVQFRYQNPDGKTVKSAREVQRQLDAEGTLSNFLLNECNDRNETETLQQPAQQPNVSSSEDSDYEPPEKYKQALKEIKSDKR